jgi:two-component system nitrate/nitrite response regulator NarL
VPHLLLATDADWILDEVQAALAAPGTTWTVCRSGQAVLAAVLERQPDLAVLDLQIGNMGAIAVTMQLRNEESGGRLPHVPVLVLLDRRYDAHLARRAGAEGWLVKPLDAMRLRTAAAAVLAGATFEGAPGPAAAGDEEPVAGDAEVAAG